jgi:hypothetical protein
MAMSRFLLFHYLLQGSNFFDYSDSSSTEDDEDVTILELDQNENDSTKKMECKKGIF